MGDNLLDVMKQACVFAVIAQMILYFRPNESYEKYLRLLAGLMLIAIIGIPLLETWKFSKQGAFQEKIEDYQEEINDIYQHMYDSGYLLEEAASQAEFMQEDRMVWKEEIKQRINNAPELKGYEVKEVGFLESENTDEIIIEIGLKKETSGEIQVKIREDAEEGEEKLRLLLAQVLGIDQERVRLEVYG